jgi:hypothetical protein
MLCHPNARVAWTILESKFLGQHESCALLHSANFHMAKQGSLPITDFSHRLETMASALCEYEDPSVISLLSSCFSIGLAASFSTWSPT